MAALLSLALLQAGCGSEDGEASGGGTEHPAADNALTASLQANQDTLTYNVINLTTWVNRLRRMIEAGNREEATASYLHARAWLGRIEPVLAALPAVSEPLLDSDDEGSFPQIEQGLKDGRLRQLRHLMKRFHRRMERLRVRIEHARLRADQVPELASEALRSLGPIVPDGRPVPQLPVIRVAANLEGTRALFLAYYPALDRSPKLRNAIRLAYGGIFRTLQEMEGKGGHPERSELGLPATEFSEFERRPGKWGALLSEQIDRLAQLFAKASRVEG